MHRAQVCCAPGRDNRKGIIENIREELNTRLDACQIESNVLGREKHLYSIAQMKNKELMFNEVMDIYAFIVVQSVDNCRALGAMHELYKLLKTVLKIISLSLEPTAISRCIRH